MNTEAVTRVLPLGLYSTERHTPSSSVRAARPAPGCKETADRPSTASLQVRRHGDLIPALLQTQPHRHSGFHISPSLLPGMTPKSISTSDTSAEPLGIPSLGSSGFSASLSLLARRNTSGLRSCLNIHLATLSAMPPVVWRQERKGKFAVFAEGSPYRA